MFLEIGCADVPFNVKSSWFSLFYVNVSSGMFLRCVPKYIIDSLLESVMKKNQTNNLYGRNFWAFCYGAEPFSVPAVLGFRSNYACLKTKDFFFVTDSTHKSKSTKRDCQNLQDQLLIVNWTCYKRKRKNGNFDYSLSKESKLAIYNGQFFSSSDFIAKEGLSYYSFSI